jgi:predicted transcriptional regulator
MLDYKLMKKLREFDYNLSTDETKELMAEYLTLYSVMFKISETCVDVSKHNKETSMAIEEIKEYLCEL